MTTLSDRPNNALMVIDVQKGVVADAHQRDAVVANISTLVDKAREEGVPIIWVQHSDEHLEKGSDAWEYVPELARRESEPLTGAQTDECIRSTIHGHRPHEPLLAVPGGARSYGRSQGDKGRDIQWLSQ